MMEKKENEFERAIRISQNAADLGFDFEDYHGPIEKVAEELRELIEVLQNDSENQTRKMDELGDVLFSVMNLARKIGVDPEAAIRLTNKKFLNRFSYVEKRIKSHVSVSTSDSAAQSNSVDLAQMEIWWVEAKELESD